MNMLHLENNAKVIVEITEDMIANGMPQWIMQASGYAFSLQGRRILLTSKPTSAAGAESTSAEVGDYLVLSNDTPGIKICTRKDLQKLFESSNASLADVRGDRVNLDRLSMYQYCDEDVEMFKTISEKFATSTDGFLDKEVPLIGILNTLGFTAALWALRGVDYKDHRITALACKYALLATAQWNPPAEVMQYLISGNPACAPGAHAHLTLVPGISKMTWERRGFPAYRAACIAVQLALPGMNNQLPDCINVHPAIKLFQLVKDTMYHRGDVVRAEMEIAQSSMFQIYFGQSTSTSQPMGSPHQSIAHPYDAFPRYSTRVFSQGFGYPDPTAARYSWDTSQSDRPDDQGQVGRNMDKASPFTPAAGEAGAAPPKKVAIKKAPAASARRTTPKD